MKNFDLLSVLKKYPVGTVDPQENFLTEAWAWVLDNNPNLLDKYLQYIFNVNLDKLSVETQFPIGNGYIDLLISNEKYCFIFEHKTGSSFDYPQIEKYVSWAKSKGYSRDSIFTATVAERVLDHSDYNKKASVIVEHLTWNNVFHFNTKFLKQSGLNENEIFILNCFNKLLTDCDLAWEYKEINMEALKNYYQVLSVNKSLEQLFSGIRDEFSWEQVYKKMPRKNMRPPKVAIDQWGRIGICLNRAGEWSPSLFFGVLYDGTDHKIKPSHPELGPDLCLILDINMMEFKNYESNPTYLKLKDEMKDFAAQIGWEFHDHLASDVKHKNKWHPLYIRKPLYKVLENCKSTEEQNKVIHKCFNDFMNAFLGIKSEAKIQSFLVFRNELQRLKNGP